MIKPEIPKKSPTQGWIDRIEKLSSIGAWVIVATGAVACVAAALVVAAGVVGSMVRVFCAASGVCS